MYVCNVWGSACMTNTLTLYLLQKRAIRFVNKLDVREQQMWSFVLKFKDLVDLKTLLVMCD